MLRRCEKILPTLLLTIIINDTEEMAELIAPAMRGCFCVIQQILDPALYVPATDGYNNRKESKR